MKCLVINTSYAYQAEIDLPVKPSIGDCLPIKYQSEKVDQVMFVTPYMLSIRPDLKGFDLLIFIK